MLSGNMGWGKRWSAYLRRCVLPAKNVSDGENVPLYHSEFSETFREDFEYLWTQLSELERHEDTLFNSRTQSFLVVTSFLLAGLSQFRERDYIFVQILFCAAGLGFSGYALKILSRTARTIEWYLEALIRLDMALHREDFQPYRTRRIKTRKRTSGENETTTGTPVSAVLGVVLPGAAGLLWFALLAWSFWHFFHKPAQLKNAPAAGGSALMEPLRSQCGVAQHIEISDCTDGRADIQKVRAPAAREAAH